MERTNEPAGQVAIRQVFVPAGQRPHGVAQLLYEGGAADAPFGGYLARLRAIHHQQEDEVSVLPRVTQHPAQGRRGESARRYGSGDSVPPLRSLFASKASRRASA